MSTKNLRDALGRLGMLAPDTNDEAAARVVAAAWSELGAIEKAAKVIWNSGLGAANKAEADAMALLESIASEAK